MTESNIEKYFKLMKKYKSEKMEEILMGKYTEIKENIKKQEGLALEAHLSIDGILSVGYGRNFSINPKINQKIADYLFELDFAAAKKKCDRFCDYYGIKINLAREGVLINMFFSTKYQEINALRKFISALKKQNYVSAAMEMLDSKWASRVKKNRAFALANIMEKGA